MYLCVYACVCLMYVCDDDVQRCVCARARACVWWNLHHTNSERLKYGLCQT